MKTGKNRRFRRIRWIAMALLALLSAAYLAWERPPELGDPERAAYGASASAEEPSKEQSEPAVRPQPVTRSVARRRSVYTLLLVGNDDGNGNTDSILVGRFDTGEHRLDLVSIPRDTLVNLDWSIRKINAVYAGTAAAGEEPIEGLRREIRKLCGFTPDAYAVVDLDLFVEAVDLIGGIDFEVPQAMHYEDPAQDLSIHLEAGPQHLNGEQAMGLVRYRSGYVNGDLDRLDVQHRFLQAALGQLLQWGSIPRLPELAELLSAYADTNLSKANLAWLARQALLCKSEDIHFYTLPTLPATIRELSYAVTDLKPWLEILNDSLNPYGEPIGAENLDLIYLEGGVLRATGGELRGSWYYE